MRSSPVQIYRVPGRRARLEDLKPFIRDLMSQMEQDLGVSLDWAAVDHFNTGHPHTHIVARGRDTDGQDLIIARDYISQGVRTRAGGAGTAGRLSPRCRA